MSSLEIVGQTAPSFNGNISKTLLFFGHQYRFQESLIKQMNLFGANIDDYKFSNGAMLNLIIEPSGDSYNLYLSLVYSGEDKKNTHGKKYWIDDKNKEVNNGNKYYFEPKNITVAKDEFKGIFKNSSSITENISCYFVRHGKAKHNIVFTVNLETNTDLVKPTNDVAIINGGKILSKKSQSIDYVFVSDLIRTQQTAALFLQHYNGTKPKKIFVLPCLHELNSGNKGVDKKIQAPYYYYENQTTCNHSNEDRFYEKNPKTCTKITIENSDIPLVWLEYENFFANNEEHRTPDNQEICNNDHFLGIALNIITQITQVNTGQKSLNGGGNPKKRTTRKSQKTRKPRKSRKSTR